MPPREPEDIFEAALELLPGELPTFLDRECEGNEELHAEIARMVALAQREPSLLEPPAHLLLHQCIGRYEILSRLGRGGMGEVFEALDPTLDRRVALKCLTPSLGLPSSTVDRLQREARILASLSDERIATLYSLEEFDGLTFITMECVEGRTLADRLRDGPLSEHEAVAICLQVARALEAAHARGIVHRDLKPTNVMIRADGGVKLIDFGVAGLIGNAVPTASRHGDVSHAALQGGTVAYMSPEQLLGVDTTGQADIWAFGCLLRESLTGECLVSLGTASSGKTRRVASRRALDPARIRSARLRRLVAWCLQVVPEDRPPSMARVRDVLESETRMGRPSWRRLLVSAVAALIGLAAIGVTLKEQRPGRAVGVEVLDKTVVRGVDAKGRARWTRSFPGGVTSVPRSATDFVDHHKVWNEDRLIGIVVFHTDSGKPILSYLDATNGEVFWQRPVRWTSPVNERGQVRYRWTSVFSWPAPERQVIGVSVVDGAWYSCAIQFLSLDGRLLGEYSHPGKIYPGGGSPPDSGDGAPFLFYGANSSARFRREIVPFETSHHPACVILLRPPQVSGQAYPYSKSLPEARDWPGMSRAQELAYLLVGPLAPEIGCAAKSASFTQSSAWGAGVEIVLDDERRLRLDADLTPRSCYLPLGSRAREILAGKDSLDVFLVRKGTLARLHVALER